MDEGGARAQAILEPKTIASPDTREWAVCSEENPNARVWQLVAACLMDVSLSLVLLLGLNAGLLPVHACKCQDKLRGGRGRGEGDLCCGGGESILFAMGLACVREACR